MEDYISLKLLNCLILLSYYFHFTWASTLKHFYKRKSCISVLCIRFKTLSLIITLWNILLVSDASEAYCPNLSPQPLSYWDFSCIGIELREIDSIRITTDRFRCEDLNKISSCWNCKGKTFQLIQVQVRLHEILDFVRI